MDRTGLVLTRKIGQDVVIGGSCVVRLVRIKGSTAVQLLIDAPRDVPVRRGELVQGEAA